MLAKLQKIKFSEEWPFKIVNITAFVFRKAASSHDAAYHDVCVLQRRLTRFNCCNIFFPLLEWGISLLINYRTRGWCWETVAQGNLMKLFFVFNEHSHILFPSVPQFPQSGLWRTERAERSNVSVLVFLTEALQRLREIWESSVLWMVL